MKISVAESMTRRGYWSEVARSYLEAEGLCHIGRKAYRSLVPKPVRNHQLGIVEDLDAPFGFRPPSLGAVRAHWNALAPYYDFQLMTAFRTEAKVLGFLADLIERQKPETVVDAGCGTGLTLVFLAKLFPGIQFLGYDIARKMVQRTRERCRKRRISNAQIFLSEHAKAPDILCGDAGIIFTKCSFDVGCVAIPDFSDAPSPSLAREDFYGSDPTMRRYEKTLAAIARLLAPRGVFLDIGVTWPERSACLWDLADRAGFEKDDSLDAVIDTAGSGDRAFAITSSGYRKT